MLALEAKLFEFGFVACAGADVEKGISKFRV